MNKSGKRSGTFFYILIPSWRNYANFDRCIESIFSQTYKNYQIIFADDASEYSISQKGHIRKKLKDHIVYFNKKRLYAVNNVYEALYKYAIEDQAVIVNVDGDDWLNGNNVLSVIASYYQRYDCFLTYGDCLIWDGKSMSKKMASVEKEFTNIVYPLKVLHKGSYRRELFFPLHLRTWKNWLYKRIKINDFRDENGNWLKYCVDMAMYFPMLEMAAGKYCVINKPLYVYNTESKNNIIKYDPIQTVREELIIRRKKPYKKISQGQLQ